MPKHDGYPMGNRDPNKRGLDKNIKNLKGGKKKNGCPLFLLALLAGVGAFGTGIWFGVSHLISLI